MLNIYENFEVDWDMTADNICGLMCGNISKSLLAKFIGVTERTISNWCNGKSKPNIENLILLSKVLNVEFFDLVITKDKLRESVDREELSRIFHENREKENRIKSGEEYKRQEKEYYALMSEEDIQELLLFRDYQSKDYPIKTLNEFLLFLPLIPMNCLADFLSRVNGNQGYHDDYIFKKMKYLYNRIPNGPAKQYAEQYKEFFLKQPCVQNLTKAHRGQAVTKKFEKWEEEWNSSWDDLNAYEEEYELFIEKMKRLHYDNSK